MHPHYKKEKAHLNIFWHWSLENIATAISGSGEAQASADSYLSPRSVPRDRSSVMRLVELNNGLQVQ